MADFDTIWKQMDEARTVVNAVLGECVWNLAYDDEAEVIELELTLHLDDDAASNLCSQFYLPADYDGEGPHGTRFVLHP